MEESRTPKNIVEFAQLVGEYYAALRKNGISTELADKLVTDWHAHWTSPGNAALALERFAPSSDVEHVGE